MLRLRVKEVAQEKGFGQGRLLLRLRVTPATDLASKMCGEL